MFSDFEYISIYVLSTNFTTDHLEVVMKTAEVMVVSDKEHLSPASCALDVCSYEAQDVLVPGVEDGKHGLEDVLSLTSRQRQ